VTIDPCDEPEPTTDEDPSPDPSQLELSSTNDPTDQVTESTEANGTDTSGTTISDGASTDAEVPAGDSDAFQLNVPLPTGAFNGPLDLLLHLIERNEMDITDVSLLQVTERYLAYLRSTDEINLGALAEFVATGARLLLLKSRALLPIEKDDSALEEDKGTDLVNALREYRRFKQAAEFFRERDTTHQTYRRTVPPPAVPLPTGLDKVTLDSLVEVLREVMDRLPEEDEAIPTLPDERIRLRDRLRGIVDLLEREQRTSFRRLVENSTSRVAVIVDFLAVLELIKSHYLEATQSERFGDIDLVRMDGSSIPDLAELAEDFTGV